MSVKFACQCTIALLLFVKLASALFRDGHDSIGKSSQDVAAGVLGSITATLILASLLYGAGDFDM